MYIGFDFAHYCNVLFVEEERLEDININFIKVMKVTQRSEIIVENDQVAPLFSSFNFFSFLIH